VILNFISKSIRSIGLVFITLFAVYNIFSSLYIQNIHTDSVVYRFLNYINSFENRFYDYRLRNNLNKTPVSKDISLLKIDDYSLNKIGTWPIPRTDHARMINQLRHFGAKVVALDIMYPEKAPVCGNDSPDQVLVKAFKDFQNDDGKRIFLAYSTGTNKEDSLETFPDEMLNDTVDVFSAPNVNTAHRTLGRYTFPNDLFVKSNVGLASISKREDEDGVFRNYLLMLNVDTVYFGSLGFNAWEAFTGKKHQIKIYQDSTAELKTDKGVLEINDMGEAKIRFIGGLEKFAHVSLFDLLKADRNDPEMFKAFKDKMVFVGSTANGAHDLRSSPIDAKMPGVLSHMNMANMLLTNYFFKPINKSIQFSLIVLALGLIIFFIAQYFGSALLDLVVIHLILSGAYAVDHYYFFPQGYEIKLFSCFFCFISCYTWNTFFKFSEASKEKKQIKGTFARYVAPTIVDEMLKDPDKLHVGGSKKDITCLFSDVRDFTSISEGLTATELAHSLNMYMGRMTDIVFETKGTLDKYIGDAIVAFWGAPLEIGNHAQHAVEGAIRMIELLPTINEEFKKLGRPEFNVGVGLNSGECNVGNMGSERIFSYTALGDNMNLGSRLESLCKYYGTQILISENTLTRIDQKMIKVRPIDKVIVKGRTTPVAIYEVMHGWHPMTKNPALYDYYQTAWGLYQSKNFQAAMNIFEEILKSFDDKPTKRVLTLCQSYIKNPELAGVDFDVTKMSEK
jgi:adenylate cyclase